MPRRLPPHEAARRRRANRAAHYAARRAAAGTPLQRTAAAWDHWRGLIGELPADHTAQWADVITAALDAHITQITKLLDGGTP